MALVLLANLLYLIIKSEAVTEFAMLIPLLKPSIVFASPIVPEVPIT